MYKHCFFSSYLLLSCLVATSAGAFHHSHFKEMADLFEQMHQMQAQLFGQYQENEPNSSSTKQFITQKMSVMEQPDKKAITISIAGVDITGEQPDASMEMNNENQTLSLTIALMSGSVTTSVYDSLIALQLSQKTTENQSSYISNRSTTQSITLRPDLEILPKIQYLKESKTLTIILTTQETTQKKAKQTVPIELK
jgi:hypothetical protein